MIDATQRSMRDRALSSALTSALFGGVFPTSSGGGSRVECGASIGSFPRPLLPAGAASGGLGGASVRWQWARRFLRTGVNILWSLTSKTTRDETPTQERPGAAMGQGSISGGMPSPDRDLHLVERAQHGDREAFRQLVVVYQERIFVVARGMVKNPEDARDIAQEVFIKAFGSLESFRGQSSFYTWLYRIAVNLSIDHRRKVGRKQESSYDDQVGPDSAAGAEVPGSGQLSPQRMFLDKELGVKIREAMESLPEEQRTTLVLRELEGLAYKEIADIMQVSQGTVMSRLFYGRKKLQEQLKDFL